MTERKVYVVGGSYDYANWMGMEVVRTSAEADVVLFTGGEDVHPDLYGEPMGNHTFSNFKRDVYESVEFQKAQDFGKHIIGICRGSQFVCVKSGGRLVQHQDNPHYIHPIKVGNGKKEILITSTHHQAQYPYDMPHGECKVIGWTEGISPFHLNGFNEPICKESELFREVEIAFYPKTKALGIQGHPEMMWSRRDSYKETFDYLHELLDKHLNNQL